MTSWPLSTTRHYQGTVTGTLWVQQAVLTVTADDQSMAWGGTIPALTCTITGYQNGDNSSVITGTPGLSTAATPASPAGSYAISVDVSTLSAVNYTFTGVAGTLTIAQTHAEDKLVKPC